MKSVAKGTSADFHTYDTIELIKHPQMAGLSIGIVLLLIFGIWLLPFIVILFSGKTSGAEKLAWLLAVVFISWFAWIFYLLLAPVSKR